MTIRNLRVSREFDTAASASVTLEVVGDGLNPLLASDCLGDELPLITIEFDADDPADQVRIVALPLKAGVDLAKQFLARLISPTPVATLPGPLIETVGYTLEGTIEPATVSVSPIVEDTFDGNGQLSARPNWSVSVADAGRWTTSSGKLAFGGGAQSIATFGASYGDHIIRYDYDFTSGPGELSFRIWQKDEANFLSADVDIAGTPAKLNGFRIRPTVNGQQAYGPYFYPTFPAVAQTKGTLLIALIKGELRVSFNGHWATNYATDYSYPFDRLIVANDLGISPANQTGPFGISAQGGGFSVLDAIAISAADIVIEKQDDFVGQVSINTLDCAATITGSYTGPDGAPFQYRRWTTDFSVAPGPWIVVTPDVAAGGRFSVDATLPYNTDSYVEVAWIGPDGRYRSTMSTVIQTGDIGIYYGQSNSKGRGSFFDVPRGVMFANFTRDTDDQAEFPRGRVSSIYNPLPTSCSLATAREVAALTGVRTAMLVSGVNSTGIEYLSPPQAGWNKFLYDRSKAKGIIKFVVWDQGENDADGQDVTLDYDSRFINVLMPALVEASGNPNLKILINTVGNFPEGAPNTFTTPEKVDRFRAYIRDMQQSIVNRSGGRVSWGSSKLGLDHGGDDYHYTNAAYAEGCARDGLSVAKALGKSATDGRGPLLTGMTRNGRVLTIAVDMNGSTTISGPTFKPTSTKTRIPPSVPNSLLGYQVALASNDGFTSLLPIESITTDGATLVVTLVTDPGAAVKARSFAGATYDDTNLFCGDNGLPVWPIITPLVA